MTHPRKIYGAARRIYFAALTANYGTHDKRNTPHNTPPLSCLPVSSHLVSQKEGTLGDMSALRGRVLGDEEAAKYWDQRGAEPGGKGVRAGVFRDDPASRSTQRRGAPGRKAWVKPPPKPVVVDRTKELDAKRNFLALKVGVVLHVQGAVMCVRVCKTCA